jgi:hypothetical protein
MHFILEAILHTLKHSWLLLPFLYITYLLMELFERRAGERAQALIRRTGKAGPAVGALLGALPQCGFSAAGAGLYAGRLITPGTLLAVFLSTSDEMIPVMLSTGASLPLLLCLVGIKIAVAIIAGFGFDLALRYLRGAEAPTAQVEELCRAGHCHCDEQPLPLAALIHTAQVFGTILLISFGLNLVIEWVGHDAITQLLHVSPWLACPVAALVGLIPNCASSVALTQLFLSGGLSAGALLAGLLPGAGVGLLVLFRVNKPLRNSLLLLSVLYIIGVLFGVLVDLSGLGILLAP